MFYGDTASPGYYRKLNARILTEKYVISCILITQKVEASRIPDILSADF